MLKKMTLLAMALAAVSAMVLPATASATWKHGHSTPIATDVDVPFTGNARFQGGLGGVECQVTSTVTFFAGQTTGAIDTFDAHPNDETVNCKGLGGLAPCQIHNLTPQTNVGWPIHTTESTIQITLTQNISSTSTGGPFCLVKNIELTQGSVTATPNNGGVTVTSATLGGQLQADIQTNGGAVHKEAVTVSGALEIEEPAKGTYSI